ncbi:Beta-glucuronosyltransferase GlcAT14B [Galdieria sulphuraria]|nr:Beta-glucuronosyltransferase GlcAT14B [Galdieria sulphuraria]
MLIKFLNETRSRGFFKWFSFFDKKTSLVPTETSKNIAFSIQVSSNNIEMVPRLMRAVYHPDNVYAVHFDAKIPTVQVQECLIELARQHFFRLNGDGLEAKDATDEMLVNQTKYFPDNIHFVPREPVTYSGITVVLNTIRLMTYLLQNDERWEYYINLSGSDYPLVSPHFLRRLLGRIPEYQTLNFLWSDPNPAQYQYRFKPVIVDSSLYSFTPPQNDTPSTADLHWLQCSVCDEGDLKRKKDIEHPFGSNKYFRTFKSEAWMVASREFCRYVVTSWEAKQLLARLTNSWMTDEHYFITLLENSAMFKDTRVDDSLRSVTWYHPRKPRGPTTHPHSVDDVDLFWSNIRCSRALFARKFTIPNGAMLDLIDRELIGEEDTEYSKEVIRKFDYLVSKTLAMRKEYINATLVGILKR